MSNWAQWISQNPLRQHRMEQQLSINRAASMLDVSHVTINHWEQDTVQPTVLNLGKVALMLGISADILSAEWEQWRQQKPREEVAS